MKHQQLEDAKNHLEQIGLTVMMNPDTELKFKGGLAYSLIDEKRYSIFCPFHIRYQAPNWIVIVCCPLVIISVSQQLRQVILAIENFYKLCEWQRENYNEIVMALAVLQAYGIAAIVNAAPDKPAILATDIDIQTVENEDTFMIEHAPLVPESNAYRIFPHQRQWAIQTPATTEISPLKIAPIIGEAAEMVVEMCGRTWSEIDKQ